MLTVPQSGNTTGMGPGAGAPGSTGPVGRPADSRHAIRLLGGRDAVAENGALLAGMPPAGSVVETEQGRQARERENESQRIFDDAALRGGMTRLHESADAFERELDGYDGVRIADMFKRTETFLGDQRSQLFSELASDGQKRTGGEYFRAFAERQRRRVERKYEEKVRAYDAGVAERQKQAFLKEAMRPENVYADEAVMSFVDMTLAGARNYLSRLPAEEGLACAGDMARSIIGPVMDYRLVTDPSSLESLTGDAGVRKLFGKETIAGYRERARRAATDDAMREQGRDWAGRGMEPGDAEAKIHAAYNDDESRARAREHFEHYRYNRRRDAMAKSRDDMDNAWKAIRQTGVRRGAIPKGVSRTNPDLADFLDVSIRRTQENGGLPPTPDYASMLEATESFSPRKTAERLGDANKFYAAVTRLGGPESAAAGVFLRQCFGESVPADRAYVSDLKYVDGIVRSDAEGSDADSLNRMIHDVMETRRTFTETGAGKNAALPKAQLAEWCRDAVDGWRRSRRL